MEGLEWEDASGELSDEEIYLEDDDDNEDLLNLSGHSKKLQFRRDASKAIWNEDMGMAEVIEKKGKMWITVGIVRGGKTYCSIEETIFLAEVGALHLMDTNNVQFSLQRMYEKISEEKNGCGWELFEVYRHLKSLGYIVGRHGVPWTMKGLKGENNSSASQTNLDNNHNAVEGGSKDVCSITELLGSLQIGGMKPVFDVYLPNSKFRKYSPGQPNFLLCLIRDNMPPSRVKIEALESLCDGIPVKCCHVEHGRVSFFTMKKAELPVLP
ncbi:unnamed protein product [Linum trigynum]|uniref:tRNA-splicing endonuclease subunit Sen54 N-terminal domain-containing protein n=1 Tax=Linum trigynum TaxID=586398 RepID=A0AAV2GWQ4_9ROSI